MDNCLCNFSLFVVWCLSKPIFDDINNKQNNFDPHFAFSLLLRLGNFFSKKKHDKKFLVERSTLIKKAVAYIFMVMLTIVWSLLASVLGSNVVDYAFDIIFCFPFILLALIAHTYCLDRFYDASNQQDDYFKLGLYLVNRKYASLLQDRQIILKVLVKSFFIPVMYMISLGGIERFLLLPNLSLGAMIGYLFVFGIALDVIVGLCGYLFVTKLVSSEILHVEDDWKGWFFCLICYPPFIYLLPSLSIFMDSHVWDATGVNEIFIWFLILVQSLTWIVYWWATVSFGFRFSNLTWRGLVDHGPYAWSKHPAYISKNLYWWINITSYLIVFNVSFIKKLEVFLLMTLVSFFYYGRAKCEEAHLLRFVDYQNYAKRIAQKKWWEKLKNKDMV